MHDTKQRATQYTRVMDYMRDGLWHTLREIATNTGQPEASVSARLREVRVREDKHRMEKSEAREGFWLYRVIPVDDNGQLRLM